MGSLKLACGALVLAVGALASADTFSFYCITNNNATDAAIGESQFYVDVADNGLLTVGGTSYKSVSFTFRNTGPAASSITRIWYDDGTLLEQYQVVNEILDGQYLTDFKGETVTPTHPPGTQQNDPSKPFYFVTQIEFSAKSLPPVEPDGVNPGEWVKLVYTLKDSKTIQDTLAAIGDGSLKIAIHGQGFESGGSETYMIIPAPGVAYGVFALLGCAGVSPRIARRAKNRPRSV